MIYRLKYAKSESNFDADFEHPTFQGAFLIVIVPRAMPWAKSFCPFRACCFWKLWAFSPYLNHLRNLSQRIISHEPRSASSL